MLRATSPTRYRQHHRSTPTPSRVRSVMALALATALTPLGTLLAASPAAAAPVANPPTLSYYAGTGSPASSGTTGPALSTPLNYPRQLAMTPNGDIYVASPNEHRIKKVTADGTMSVVAGIATGAAGTAGTATSGGQATSSPLRQPWGVAVNAVGDVFIADTSNNGVLRVDHTSGVMTRIAGSPTGASGSTSGGTATSQLLNGPRAVAVDVDGAVYVADTGNHRIVKIDGGTMTVVAGTGVQSTRAPLGGPATTQSLNGPNGIAVDAAKNLYITDGWNHQVEKVTPAGMLSVVVGTGEQAAAPATAGRALDTALFNPYGVAVDAAGNIYVADTRNRQVDKVTPAGDLSVIAGTGVQGSAVNGAVATATPLGTPISVVAAAGGVVYITDTDTARIYKLTPPPGTVPAITSGAPTGASATLRTGTPFTFTPSATGSPTPTWSITSGSLPAGLSLNTTTGTISGTPTATGPASSTFTLRVATSAGYDEQSLTLTTAGVPTAPRALTATAGDASVVLTWTAPSSDGGSPITGYTATASPGGAQCTSTSSATRTCTITGLANATAYTVTATATNAVGISAASAASAPVTPVARVLPGQVITTDAPVSMVRSTRTLALAATVTAALANGNAVAPGALGFTSTSAAVCTVVPSAATTSSAASSTPSSPAGAGSANAVVTALSTGTCALDVTAEATTTHAATTLHLSMEVIPTATPGLPGGLTRLGGPNAVDTSDDSADAGFPTPGPGSSYDVVVASAERFVDSLPGARLAGHLGGPLLLTPHDTLAPETAAQIKRLVHAGGTVYLLGGTNALSLDVERTTAALVPAARVVRLGGPDRYDTAVLIADTITAQAGQAAQSAPIYLVTGRDFADGVTVAPYAQRTGGVLLLTDDSALPSATAAYLRAHDPADTRAVPVGGYAKGAVVGRDGARARAITGSDRYSTAAALAAAWPTSGPVAVVGVAGGSSWADALTGAAAMSALGGPLLLTPTGTATLAPASADSLEALRPGKVLVFGGVSAVSAGASGEAAHHLRA